MTVDRDTLAAWEQSDWFAEVAGKDSADEAARWPNDTLHQFWWLTRTYKTKPRGATHRVRPLAQVPSALRRAGMGHRWGLDDRAETTRS